MKYINTWKLFVGSFIPNWLMQRQEISHGAKLCYGRLCQYAGQKGYCFPSQETISEELGISYRQTQRYIKELIRVGLIVIEKYGTHNNNQYRFIQHEWMGIDDISDVPNPTVPSSVHDTSVVSDTSHLSFPILRESVKENQKENQLSKDFSFSQIVDSWNLKAEEYGLSKVLSLTKSRKEKLKARLEDDQFYMDDIMKAIATQPFLRGVNDRKWQVTFDWVISNDKNYLKILEYNYVKAKPTGTTGTNDIFL